MAMVPYAYGPKALWNHKAIRGFYRYATCKKKIRGKHRAASKWDRRPCVKGIEKAECHVFFAIVFSGKKKKSLWESWTSEVSGENLEQREG